MRSGECKSERLERNEEIVGRWVLLQGRMLCDARVRVCVVFGGLPGHVCVVKLVE